MPISEICFPIYILRAPRPTMLLWVYSYVRFFNELHDDSLSSPVLLVKLRQVLLRLGIELFNTFTEQMNFFCLLNVTIIRDITNIYISVS